MENKLKHLAIAVGLSLPIFASANTMLCLDEDPCYMSNEATEMMMELGDMRPMVMKFESGENSVSATYSETMGMARKFLFGTNLMALRKFRMEHRGEVILPEMLPNLPLSKYDKVNFTLFNKDLAVIFIKPINKVLIRRAAEDSMRVEMSFEAFISALKQAYAEFHDRPKIQSNFGGIVMKSDYKRLAVLVSTCTTSGSGSHEAAQEALNNYLGCRDRVRDRIHPRHVDEFGNELATPELGEDETSFSDGITLNQTTYYQKYQSYESVRSYIDLEGETERDFTHHEINVLALGENEQGEPIGGGGYARIGATRGDQELGEPTVHVRDPQVTHTSSEATTTVNGRTVESGTLDIDIQGEDSINRTMRDSDYFQWLRDTLFKKRREARNK